MFFLNNIKLTISLQQRREHEKNSKNKNLRSKTTRSKERKPTNHEVTNTTFRWLWLGSRY